MAYVDRYDAAFGIYISRYIRQGVHTNIRGKVVGVNYGVPSVDVQPMAETKFPSGTVDKYPVIFDVPLMLPSGSGGKARLTMPVKVGDFVGLSFSERNEGNFDDQTTHQLFPGWAVTQIFTSGNSKPIDPDNVVLENDKAKITLKPSGDGTIANDKVNISFTAAGEVKATNGVVTLTMSPSGTGSLTNSGGGLALQPSGQIMMNGAQVTPTGRIKTANGLDMDDFYAEYKAHSHGGVDRGNSRTDPVG